MQFLSYSLSSISWSIFSAIGLDPIVRAMFVIIYIDYEQAIRKRVNWKQIPVEKLRTGFTLKVSTAPRIQLGLSSHQSTNIQFFMLHCNSQPNAFSVQPTSTSKMTPHI